MSRTQIDPTLAPRIASTKNYISNSDAEFNAITGWALYANTAQSTPVTGIGGSPNITLVTSNSAPLDGLYSFVLTKDAANRQGQGVSYDFAIDPADQATVLSIQFNYNASSSFVAGTASPTITNSDLTVWLYDITNAVLIPVSPFTLQGNGTSNFVFRGVCQTNSNSTSYRLIMHIATTNALAWVVKFDNVFVGRQPVLYGSPVTDWQSYTPSLSSSNCNATAFYRRVGDSLQIRANVSFTGTGTGSTLQVGLPSGYSLDTTKNNDAAYDSVLYRLSSGSNPISTGNNLIASTPTVISFRDPTVSVASLNGTSFSSGGFVFFTIMVPIAGLSSTVLMSNDTDTRVVAAEITYGPSTLTIPSTGVYTKIPFDTVTKDTHGAYNTGSQKYFVPVAGYYHIHGSIYYDQTTGTGSSNAALYINGNQTVFSSQGKSGSTSVPLVVNYSFQRALNAGDALEIYTIQTLGSNAIIRGDADAYGLTSMWIERITGPSAVAATETVACRYANQTALALTTSPQTILYQTKVIDTHSAFNTSTGIFTAPTSGTYLIMGKTSGNASASNANNNMYLYAMKNGVLFQRDFWQFIVLNNAAPVILEVSALQPLVAGDQIKMQAFVDNAVSCTLSTDVNVDTIDIVRVGN